MISAINFGVHGHGIGGSTFPQEFHSWLAFGCAGMGMYSTLICALLFSDSINAFRAMRATPKDFSLVLANKKLLLILGLLTVGVLDLLFALSMNVHAIYDMFPPVFILNIIFVELFVVQTAVAIYFLKKGRSLNRLIATSIASSNTTNEKMLAMVRRMSYWLTLAAISMLIFCLGFLIGALTFYDAGWWYVFIVLFGIYGRISTGYTQVESCIAGKIKSPWSLSLRIRRRSTQMSTQVTATSAISISQSPSNTASMAEESATEVDSALSVDSTCGNT